LEERYFLESRRESPVIRIGASTLLYFKRPLSEGVALLLERGFRHIELFCDEPHGNPFHISKREIQKIQRLKEKHDLQFSIHAPCFDLNPASINPRIREEVFEHYRESLNLARKVRASAVVVHLGNQSDMKLRQDESLIRTIQLLKRVLKIAENYRILLLAENTDYGNLSMVKDVEQYRRVIYKFHSPFMKAILDTGHANLNGIPMVRLIKRLGRRLGSLHISDNQGDKDAHLPPGQGSINFKLIFTALENIQFNGTVILEIYDENSPLEALEWSSFYIRNLCSRCQM
jgi:sugar phosphate isomerase/epimerase